MTKTEITFTEQPPTIKHLFIDDKSIVGVEVRNRFNANFGCVRYIITRQYGNTRFNCLDLLTGYNLTEYEHSTKGLNSYIEYLNTFRELDLVFYKFSNKKELIDFVMEGK